MSLDPNMMKTPVVLLERLPENLVCFQCGRGFISPQQLIKHKADVHLFSDSGRPRANVSSTSQHEVSQVFSCPKCRRHFATHLCLKKHEKKEHQRVPHLYRCSECGRGFALQDTRDLHLSTFHNERLPRPCADLSRSSGSSDEEPCNCILIKQEFSDDEADAGVLQLSYTLPPPPNGAAETNLQVKEETLVPDIVSNDVGASDEDDIGVVVDKYDPARPFKCQTCCLSFLHQSSLVKHNCERSVSKVLLCSLCNSTFENRSSLFRHIRKHFLPSSKEAPSPSGSSSAHIDPSTNQSSSNFENAAASLLSFHATSDQFQDVSFSQLESGTSLKCQGYEDVAACEQEGVKVSMSITSDHSSSSFEDPSKLCEETFSESFCDSGAGTSGALQKARRASSVSKLQRDYGLEHVNSRGILVRARKMGKGCDSSCRFKCHSKMDLEDREEIFSKYWGLGNNVLQWAYIAKHTTVYVPTRITKGRRSESRRYWFEIKGKLVKVCKSMFVSTLDISDCLIKTATTKQRYSSHEVGFIDMRGKMKKKQTNAIPVKRTRKKKSKKLCDGSLGAQSRNTNEAPVSNDLKETKDHGAFLFGHVQQEDAAAVALCTDSSIVEENDSLKSCVGNVLCKLQENDPSDDFNQIEETCPTERPNLMKVEVTQDYDHVLAACDFEGRGCITERSELQSHLSTEQNTHHNLPALMGEACFATESMPHHPSESLVRTTLVSSGEMANECGVSLPPSNFQSNAEKIEPGSKSKKLSKSLSKLHRDHGFEHLNSRGYIVRAKRLGSGCSETCRFKCHSKITEEERKFIFNEYWELGNNALQWAFIAKCTTLYAPKKVTGGRRTASRRYWFEVGGKMLNVCKSMFITTLDISDSIINTALLKQNFGPDGDSFSDLRGKHSRPKCSPIAKKKRRRKKKVDNMVPETNTSASHALGGDGVELNMNPDSYCVPASSDSSKTYESTFSKTWHDEKRDGGTLFESERNRNMENSRGSRNVDLIEVSECCNSSAFLAEETNKSGVSGPTTLDDLSCPEEENVGQLFDMTRHEEGSSIGFNKEQATSDFGESSIGVVSRDICNASAKKLHDHETKPVDCHGETVRGRRMRPGCGQSCRSKCERKISEIERECVFSEYWGLGNNSLQWEYLAKCTTLHPVKQISSGRRKASRRYWLHVGGRIINVCKSMFVNTLDISDSIINTAILKQSTNLDEDPFTDKRGKHGNRYRAVSSEVYQSIIHHVNSIPRVLWRCCENDVSKDYLQEGTGSVAKMYRLYKDLCDNDNSPESVLCKMVTERQYRDIFLKEFPGLHIFTSKLKCDLCRGKDVSVLNVLSD